LDIFIEPVLPKPHLVILGRSPVAQTLARLAKSIHYRVSVASPEADVTQFPDVDHLQTNLDLASLKISGNSFVVVSTQGASDEEALQQAASTGAGYVAFVASKVKAQKVLEYLREAGVPTDRVSQIRAPAGLDIHAASPEEIAVSVLAEIIQFRGLRTKATSEAKATNVPVLKKAAKDPVCGMVVDAVSAKYKSEHNGNSIYFCCAACKQTFDRQPEKYLATV
jgi:xanthine dehydrogenase accessory factor